MTIGNEHTSLSEHLLLFCESVQRRWYVGITAYASRGRETPIDKEDIVSDKRDYTLVQTLLLGQTGGEEKSKREKQQT